MLHPLANPAVTVTLWMPMRGLIPADDVYDTEAGILDWMATYGYLVPGYSILRLQEGTCRDVTEDLQAMLDAAEAEQNAADRDWRRDVEHERARLRA